VQHAVGSVQTQRAIGRDRYRPGRPAAGGVLPAQRRLVAALLQCHQAIGHLKKHPAFRIHRRSIEHGRGRTDSGRLGVTPNQLLGSAVGRDRNTRAHHWLFNGRSSMRRDIRFYCLLWRQRLRRGRRNGCRRRWDLVARWPPELRLHWCNRLRQVRPLHRRTSLTGHAGLASNRPRWLRRLRLRGHRRNLDKQLHSLLAAIRTLIGLCWSQKLMTTVGAAENRHKLSNGTVPKKPPGRINGDSPDSDWTIAACRTKARHLTTTNALL